jgi:hypothetical protein
MWFKSEGVFHFVVARGHARQLHRTACGLSYNPVATKLDLDEQDVACSKCSANEQAAESLKAREERLLALEEARLEGLHEQAHEHDAPQPTG